MKMVKECKDCIAYGFCSNCQGFDNVICKGYVKIKKRLRGE